MYEHRDQIQFIITVNTLRDKVVRTFCVMFKKNSIARYRKKNSCVYRCAAKRINHIKH